MLTLITQSSVRLKLVTANTHQEAIGPLMKNDKLLYSFLTVIFVVGCGGGSSENGAESKSEVPSFNPAPAGPPASPPPLILLLPLPPQSNQRIKWVGV